MSIRYFHPNDEDSIAYNPWISDGSDDGWWAGVQQCAATIALAATLVITGTSTAQAQQQVTWGASQDDPAGNLVNFCPDEDFCQRRLYSPHLRVYSQGADGQLVLLFDEDYWQNPVRPVSGTNYVVLPFTEHDDAPVGSLLGVAEEDYWQNSVSSVNNPSVIPQQWTFDVQEPAGSLILLQDEDFWQNPVAPVSSYPVPITFKDVDEIALPAILIVPDEDYWQSKFVIPNHKVYGRGGGSGVGTVDDEPYSQPVLADFGYRVTLWIDDSATIPKPLFLDEDLWQNSVLPVTPPAFSAIPHVFTDDEVWVPFNPFVPLPFDEEFWPQANAVAPIASYPVPHVFTDDDILVPFSPFVPLPFDEETWQQQASLDVTYPVTLWMDDTQTIIAPVLLPDEDFWQNSVQPVLSTFVFPQQWTFDVQEASLEAIPDEDYWQNPVRPVVATLGPIYLPDTNDEPAGSLEGDLDEDYWQNPVLPVQSRNYVKLPFVPDPDEIPSGSLHGLQDEDYWQNPVRPVPASNSLLLPFVIDPEFNPAGSLSGQPDEDFWINPVAPISSYPVPFVYRDQEEIPVGFLYVHPDEDYWQNPVKPVSYIFGKLYAFDLDDVPAGSFHGTFEDDSWTNPVWPISGFIPPIVFSDDEITVPTPPSPREEDFWQNAVLPIAAANYISFPYLPDPEEIPAGSLVPPQPPNPCPCSGIPNIPKDRVYDIVLCDQGIVGRRHVWLACIFAQPGSLLAQHMGSSIVTLYVYGTQAEAFAEARQFVNHNMGTQ